MKIGAIICEFNPLHNGHLYLINEAKKKCDFLIAIMSGEINQRGIPSLVSKETKAKWAINAGFDLVVENNFEYVIQSADFFANGAIMQANLLNVDYLFFGSENYTANEFHHIAKVLNKNEYKIKELINGKTNYPRVIGSILKENGIILDSPNDLLGLSYLKAIFKYNAKVKLCPIKRLGGFHSLVPYNNSICSATYIREQIKLKKLDELKNYIPDYVLRDLKKAKHLFDFSDFEGQIIKNIYNMDRLELKQVFGVDEGLENRIHKLLNQNIGLDSLINLVKTKRYTYNRLQRMFLNIGFNVLKKEINNDVELKYINYLDSTKRGINYLRDNLIYHYPSPFDTRIKKVYNKINILNKGDINMSFVIEAQIEIQKGSRNKYETLENGKLKLDRVLPSAQVYPTDYGFFNQTLGQDGDPLDVLILSSEPLLPTCLVDVRVVGVMFMVDGGEKDEKLIAVVDEDPRFDHIEKLADVPVHTLKVISNYFSTYKAMQNKVTEVIGFEEASVAEQLYADAVERFNK